MIAKSSSAADHHAALHAGFRWKVPREFNIADQCCTRWASQTPEAVAIAVEQLDGRCTRHSYAELNAEANRLSNALRRRGVERGDRVAILMPQRFETAVAHMAIQKLGAVVMPLSMLFGPDALEYRLNDSEARVAIADESSIANLLSARTACPALATVVAVGGAAAMGDVDWNSATGQERAEFDPLRTLADDPALLV
jgi:acetyl-CoA synthetase